MLLHRARAGSVIAEASLFADRCRCDAVAPHDAEVTLLERESLRERFGTDPSFARALAESFAREVQRLRRQIELVGISGAETRVLEAIRDGLLTGTDICGLADSIGLSPEATSRALGAACSCNRDAIVTAWSERRADRRDRPHADRPPFSTFRPLECSGLTAARDETVAPTSAADVG